MTTSYQKRDWKCETVCGGLCVRDLRDAARKWEQSPLAVGRMTGTSIHTTARLWVLSVTREFGQEPGASVGGRNPGGHLNFTLQGLRRTQLTSTWRNGIQKLWSDEWVLFKATKIWVKQYIKSYHHMVSEMETGQSGCDGLAFKHLHINSNRN